MKLLVVFLLVSSSFSKFQVSDDDDERVALTSDEIDFINSAQSLWKASSNWMTSMKLKDLKLMLSQEEQKSDFPEYKWDDSFDFTAIPPTFSAAANWPNCVAPVGNQGNQCSAGYAFSVAASISERYCIMSSKYTGVVFSPQYLTLCGTITQGCTAGTPDQAWAFLTTEGTALANCQGWKGYGSSCSYVCDNGTPATMYTALPNSIYQYTSAASIQAAIYTQGAITSSVTVYSDFVSYSSGIYTRVGRTPVGNQAIKIFGWGVSGGTNYWICSNSWGTTWGQNGIVWIAFGQVGVDSTGLAGSPSL